MGGRETRLALKSHPVGRDSENNFWQKALVTGKHRHIKRKEEEKTLLALVLLSVLCLFTNSALWAELV